MLLNDPHLSDRLCDSGSNYMSSIEDRTIAMVKRSVGVRVWGLRERRMKHRKYLKVWNIFCVIL